MYPYSEVDECESDGCPVDCVMSDWEAKTECSVSCGGGTLSESDGAQALVAGALAPLAALLL